FTTSGVYVQENTSNGFGSLTFSDVGVGSYYVSVSDPNGAFALKTSDSVTVTANQTTNTSVKLSKQVQGTLTVKVIDSTTNAIIPNATVKLIQSATNQVLATQLTDTLTGTVHAEVSEAGPFRITVEKENYLAYEKTLPVISGSQTHAAVMEKLTAANSGKVSIHVTDEDGIPVDNAEVLLYNGGTGFIAHAFTPKVTDVNGAAVFTGVTSGGYFARAIKYPAGPSDSSVFQTQQSIPAKANLTLTLGEAGVEVTALDLEGNPVPFAQVSFLTDGSDECKEGECVIQADAQGKASRSFKADRKVYVNVSANGHAPFYSMSRQLYAGKVESVTAVLPENILGNQPIMQLVGINDPVTGKLAAEMKAGKTYVAVFRLQIPSALSPSSAGIHVRVGDETLLENDGMEIVGVNIPNTSVGKGTSYNPALGYTADQAHLTNGNAKWVNAEWNNPSSGVYEAGVLIRVKPTTGKLEPIALHYRGWVVNGGKWLRNPEDGVLGNGNSSPTKEAQYAETFQQIYYTGKPVVCDELFCYSGESVL
ncbi:MAG: hypothetical protein AABY11_03210, partial [archaeon]